MKTKAVRLYGANDLRLEEFELPEIKDDEILVKVMSDSICMSTYKLLVQGKAHKRCPQDVDVHPVIIGHELTHGFDDQGCQFDANGNMVNWWTPQDAEEFAKLTQGLVGQFDEIEVLPGLHANGQYTLGENIADQGGLRVARTAFLDSQKKKGVDVKSEAAKIDGFDPMQVFYMNFANLWAQNIRDEEIRSLTSGDVHSLGNNRVNVSLKNIAPFFEAFGIKEGDKMFRPEAERVIIW